MSSVKCPFANHIVCVIENLLQDKCTLRLFNSVVQAGKVERGFDLVRRLHSEKAMDLAIQCADRIGHRKLNDRIEELKEQRYPPLNDKQEGFDEMMMVRALTQE